MGRRFCTVFILPHAQGRFRKIHVSRNFLLSLGVLVVLLAAGGVLAPSLYLRLKVQALEVQKLEMENQSLRKAKQEFESSLERLSMRLNQMENTAARLAGALGLEQVPGLEPAAGGASLADGRTAASLPESLFEEELGALSVRTDNLSRSLERLYEAWEDRERILASTPNTMPVRGWFSDGFGWRRDPFNGRREFHKGLDIVAPPGAVVRATADGVVTFAGRTAGYGKMVDLHHGFGFRTRYGHLSEVVVKPGQRVRRGDPIGRVGSTGRSTGPHLHYEVFREGRRVNPWSYLGDRPS